MKRKLPLVITGVFTGLVNGLLGGAAGLLCVPALSLLMKDEKQAHAYTLTTVLAASAVSAAAYIITGEVTLADSWKYILGGLLAAPLGVKLLKKIKSELLERLFSVFIIYCAVRMLFE